MKEFLKNISIRKYWFLPILRNKSNYLRASGWIESFKLKKSVNAQREPVPWFTLPTIDFLNKKLHKEITVLEYGSGNSTLYLCHRCESVTTIEDNTEWYNYVKSNIPSNGTIINSDISQYSKQIKTITANPDLVIIDGKVREDCIREIRNNQHNPSIIILDDSERTAYTESIKDLHQDGYKSIEFWGMAPGIDYKKCTTIFYLSPNCLVI